MTATIVKDKNDPNAIRVEAIVEDDAVEVAIFSGPKAHDRATSFALSWYPEWTDETGIETEISIA